MNREIKTRSEHGWWIPDNGIIWGKFKESTYTMAGFYLMSS